MSILNKTFLLLLLLFRNLSLKFGYTFWKTMFPISARHESCMCLGQIDGSNQVINPAIFKYFFNSLCPVKL